MITELYSSVKQWLGLKQRGVQATARLKTDGYTTIDYSYWTQMRELPPFDFWAIMQMLNDPQVRLSLAIRSAPLYGVEFGYKDQGQFIAGVKCQRPEVAAFIESQVKKIWLNHLQDILKAQIWGWSGAEVCLKIGSSGLIEINRLEFRNAQDIRLLKSDGKPAGVLFSRIEDKGSVAISFPEAFFHAHNPEPGQDYGTSILKGAFAPWCDKWLNGGALDVRRLFMHRDAYAGGDLGYPDGVTFIDGQAIPNRDIARDILDKMRSGHAIARPSERDERGNEKWPFQRAQVTANPSHILQYPQDLDDEIRRGIEIPDGVIDDAGTGAWGGKRIPMAAFYASLDCWVVKVLNDMSEQLFEHLVMMNFSEAVDFEIDHKPLAEQAMEQQSNAGGGAGADMGMGMEGMMPGMEGGMPGMPPDAGMGDQMGDIFSQFGEQEQQPMSMALKAAQLIDNAKIRLALDEPSDEAAKAQAIADLLVHLFGDDAEEMIDTMLAEQESVAMSVRKRPWNPLNHPRGADGRFIEKNSPEAISAAKSSIKEALSGKRTTEKVKRIAENLNILTTKQIRDVMREYSVKAGGAKQTLVDKVSKLLTGAVVDTESEETVETTVGTEVAAKTNGTPANPERRNVYTVPVEAIHADPERFQYKVKGIDKQGVTEELKGVGTWNPELGGVLLVWRDPEDGKDYVVNGHHRLHLAKRLGADELNVRYIDAGSAKIARSVGALANIAEGRGSAIDAAKYLRDTDQTMEDLKSAGVSLSGKIAADALVLKDLADRPFNMVTRGMLEEETAIAVAKHLKDHDLQNKLFRKLEDREEQGAKEWSNREIETAARKMANAGKVETDKAGLLFDDWDDEESTFDSEVALEAFVSANLRKVANDFAAVASRRRAERVSEAGNVLQIEENQKRAREADEIADMFQREVNLRGPVADAIKYHALDFHQAKTKKEQDRIKAETLESIRDVIGDLINPPEVEAEVPEPVMAGAQQGLFGDMYEPGRYSESEMREYTGSSSGTPMTRLPNSERQDSLFDIGKKSDLPGQTLLFEQDSGGIPNEQDRFKRSDEYKDEIAELMSEIDAGQENQRTSRGMERREKLGQWQTTFSTPRERTSAGDLARKDFEKARQNGVSDQRLFEMVDDGAASGIFNAQEASDLKKRINRDLYNDSQDSSSNLGQPQKKEKAHEMSREEWVAQGNEEASYDRALWNSFFDDDNPLSREEIEKRAIRDSRGVKEIWAQTRKEIEQDGKDSVKNAKKERAAINKQRPTKEYAKWRIDSESRQAKRNIESISENTKGLLEVHKERVIEALEEGKPVPAEVLADYPDLKKKYGKNESED
jgi:hypothetical protein